MTRTFFGLLSGSREPLSIDDIDMRVVLHAQLLLLQNKYGLPIY